VSDKFGEKIKIHILFSRNSFNKNRHDYEIMWEIWYCTVGQAIDDNPERFACWKDKATHTHTQTQTHYTTHTHTTHKHTHYTTHTHTHTTHTHHTHTYIL